MRILIQVYLTALTLSSAYGAPQPLLNLKSTNGSTAIVTGEIQPANGLAQPITNVRVHINGSQYRMSSYTVNEISMAICAKYSSFKNTYNTAEVRGFFESVVMIDPRDGLVKPIDSQIIVNTKAVWRDVVCMQNPY